MPTQAMPGQSSRWHYMTHSVHRPALPADAPYRDRMAGEPHEVMAWRTLVAVGLVAGQLSAASIARYGSVQLAEAERALAAARSAGFMSADDLICDTDRLLLVAELSAERVASIHAAAARHFFTSGPDGFAEAITHARAAGAAFPSGELVAMADHGGRLSLSLHEYRVACDLLRLADESDVSADVASRARRLCDLAVALDGLGDVTGARAVLARAVSLGELAGDAGLVARAACQYALPADWYLGDPRAAGLLQRAEAMPLKDDDRVRVLAARAFVENRIPVAVVDGQQTSWVTRPSAARPYADEALDASVNGDDDVRTLALLAWRTTHRAPRFLDHRRTVSMEALDLTQRLRNPSRQVEAAVMLAVDAIESGDRPLYDQALSVARWVAERDGNPRLRWRAYTLAAGAAYMDDEPEQGRLFRRQAREIGESIGTPGWLGAEMLFIGYEAITSDDPALMQEYLFDDEESPALSNPLGRACVAYMFARNGHHDIAERHARRAMRQLDEEASYLVLAARLAHVASVLRVTDLTEQLIEVLTPWSDRVAVDSNAWCCDGPVSAWLALLHHGRGDIDQTVVYLDRAECLARGLHDRRTLRRMQSLRTVVESDCLHVRPLLTRREQLVLDLLATGVTRQQVAAELGYSLSTVRNDMSALYRKLGATTRTEAMMRALELHLVHRVDRAN